LPVERLKEVWKAEKLNRVVQLTISGCLGPCDLANVALIISPQGNDWFGGMAGDAIYDSLIGWAQECRRENKLLPLPVEMGELRFSRFATEEIGA